MCIYGSVLNSCVYISLYPCRDLKLEIGKMKRNNRGGVRFLVLPSWLVDLADSRTTSISKKSENLVINFYSNINFDIHSIFCKKWVEIKNCPSKNWESQGAVQQFNLVWRKANIFEFSLCNTLRQGRNTLRNRIKAFLNL